MDDLIKGLGIIFLGIASIIIFIPLAVLFGWWVGLILKMFCGDLITYGLNLLFNTNRFIPENIPFITATLSVLTGYFRTTTTVKKS